MARSIPIIELYGNLIVAIQIELSDRLIAELKDDLCFEIQRRNTKGLVIEVSGVDIFDTFIAHSVREIAQVVRLMGVHTVLAGLDPGMAITLVEMGMSMKGVDVALNLEGALDMLNKRRAEDAKHNDLHLLGTGLTADHHDPIAAMIEELL